MDRIGMPHLRSVKRFLAEIPRWLLGITLILPSISFVIGWQFGNTIPPNIDLFLSALAGAQASVLAIVFSVTILGIQLVATRYSPRMTQLFVRAPIFTYTFGILVTSVALDLWILYNVDSAYGPLFVGGVYFAAAWAVVATASLYAYIVTALERSTPDGIISAFANDLTPDKYHSRVQESMSDDKGVLHPLHPLYSLIMSSISQDEWKTAERGLNHKQQIATDTARQLSKTGVIPIPDHTKESRALFRTPFQEYLPEIAIHSIENDETELASNSLQICSEVAQVGIENYRNKIAHQAATGISKTIREAPYNSAGISVRSTGFRELGELLIALSKQPDFEEFSTVLSISDNSIEMMFRGGLEQRQYQPFLLEYFGSALPETQEIYLDYFGGYLPEAGVNWRSQNAPHDRENSQFFRYIFKWRDSFINTSVRILRYRAENDEYPVADGNFYDTWKRVCEDAISLTEGEYAIVLTELFIEMAYEDYLIEERDRGSWVRHLAYLKENGGHIVEQAFDDLETNGRTEIIRRGYLDPRRNQAKGSTTFWDRFTSGESSPDNDFSSWLLRFEKEVNKTHIELFQG